MDLLFSALIEEGERSLVFANRLSRDLVRADEETATTTVSPESGNEGTDIATSILTIVINVAYIVYYVFIGNFGAVFTTGFNLLETIWKMIFG